MKPVQYLIESLSAFEKANIDKNVPIGDGVVVMARGEPDNLDGENYYIRDGVAVVQEVPSFPSELPYEQAFPGRRAQTKVRPESGSVTRAASAFNSLGLLNTQF